MEYSLGSFSLIPGVTFLAEIFLLRNSCLPLPPACSNISSYSPIASKRQKWKVSLKWPEPTYYLRWEDEWWFSGLTLAVRRRRCEAPPRHPVTGHLPELLQQYQREKQRNSDGSDQIFLICHWDVKWSFLCCCSERFCHLCQSKM